MRREVTFSEAIKAAAAGDEVLVAVPDDQHYRLMPLEDYFNECWLMIGGRPENLRENTSKAPGNDREAKGVQSAAKKPMAPTKKKPTKKVDAGKIIALHKAGWTGKAIADELKISEATVSTYIKKLQEDRDAKVAE